MPDYGECRSEEINATPQACFDALTDFEKLPSWQGSVKSVRVLERDAEGRGSVIEFEVDARVKRVRYRLRQVYDEPKRIGSEYLGGDFRDFTGEWRVRARGGGAGREGGGPRGGPGGGGARAGGPGGSGGGGGGGPCGVWGGGRGP